jgi:hypothetical protein
MDGRTYWVSPQFESYPLFNQDPEDGTYAERPYGYTDYRVYDKLEVPNGAWVLERTLSSGYMFPAGAKMNEPESHTLFNGGHFVRVLYCSDKPFGFVLSEEAGWQDEHTFIQVPKGPCRLDYARQIHKGELGQGTPIPKIKFAREHKTLARKYGPPRNLNRRSNPFRWARLDEVVKASGMSFDALLEGYWPFVGNSHTYDHANQRGGMLLHARFGDTRMEIESQTHPHSYLTLEELRNLVEAGNLDFIWIRAGLANTFLRLRALGYEPTRTASTTT